MSEANKLKRITQNTILLFIRILVLTLVNLYAVRLLLRGLGQCDYGIYNAVAGVVTLSSCLIPVFHKPYKDSIPSFLAKAIKQNYKLFIQ